MMEAIVLAGGFGTRLRSVVSDMPKPMADINGKPFLFYLMQYLHLHGVGRVVLAVGYKYEVICDYFGSSFNGMEIVYSIEDKPLGTGGCIRKAMELCDDEAFVINGDTYFDVDLKALAAFHKEKGAQISLAAKMLSRFDRYGTLVIDEERMIIDFVEKKLIEEGLINGGIYYLSKRLFDSIELPEVFSMEKDLFEKFSEELKLYAFVAMGYFIDIGVPEDYFAAQNYFTAGKE